MRHRITNEEKAAKKLYDLVNTLDANLDLIGYYFARLSGRVHFNRLEIIYEAAAEEKEEKPIDY